LSMLPLSKLRSANLALRTRSQLLHFERLCPEIPRHIWERMENALSHAA